MTNCLAVSHSMVPSRNVDGDNISHSRAVEKRSEDGQMQGARSFAWPIDQAGAGASKSPVNGANEKTSFGEFRRRLLIRHVEVLTVRAEPVEAHSPFDKLKVNGLQTSLGRINNLQVMSEPPTHWAGEEATMKLRWRLMREARYAGTNTAQRRK